MKFEFSAGGVVFKRENDGLFILLARHSQHHGWVFPKGIIGDTKENEGKEETAIREVKEETGIDARILKPLSSVVYWYSFKGEKRKKTVYYFVMEHSGGNTEERDDEMEAVEWLPFDTVADRLTYPSDKKVWQEARQIIGKVE